MPEITFEQAVELGIAYQKSGRLAEAETVYRQILARHREHPDALHLLGLVAYQMGRNAEALELIGCAVRARPGVADFHNSLGLVLSVNGPLDEAIEHFRAALAIEPDFAEAHYNLGNALKDQGRIAEALQCYRRTMEVRPGDRIAHSNFLYTMHFHPDFGPEEIYREHRLWNERHAAPLKDQIRPHANDPSPQRRLKVGYVSPDFRANVVGRFIAPLLPNHDRDAFEVFCYADVAEPDWLTGQLRGCADTWQSTVGMNDEQLAELVRRDGIDVLIDLSLHARRHRLLAFARKPAPVQATYLSYCSTSGLDTMDYRITDPYLDPPAPAGEEDAFYSERSIRLPETYWCYQPLPATPAVNASPAAARGFLTFGCFNNFCKVSDATVDTWCRVLREVSNSRLMLYAKEGSHRDRLHRRLEEQRVDPRRLEFVGRTSTEQYLARYHEIDIALDPFPYVGGTSTCDALWMGVPVVSLAGRTAVSRGGRSILSNIGLSHLVADSQDQYVSIAADLATDLARLAELRATLRERMQASPLMDGPGFARNMEAAYRTMWREWCERPLPPR